jgi:phosphate/sulfate permease
MLPRVKRKFFIFNAKTRFSAFARAFKHGGYTRSMGTVPIAQIYIEWGPSGMQVGCRAMAGLG